MNIFERTIQHQSQLGWLVVATDTTTGHFLPIRDQGRLNLLSDDLTQLNRTKASAKADGT